MKTRVCNPSKVNASVFLVFYDNKTVKPAQHKNRSASNEQVLFFLMRPHQVCRFAGL